MIDLRSDTVTRPTPAMRDAMREAEVGDDVYGEDPTVNALERRAAERLGTEAALFTTSGTQANLVSLLTHAGRGDAYIVGRSFHSYDHEGGGAAALGGVHPVPVDHGDDGRIRPETIRENTYPADDPHYPRTRVLSLEVPHHGRVAPLEATEEACRTAREAGLACHLDGARLFNAAVANGVEAADIAAPFDTVMFDLSKSLGTPVGGILCGPAEVIDEARRWRKVVGGGWRQAGILAAAGLYALDHHVDRLADDHANARRLAEQLADIDGLTVDPDAVETNMVFAEPSRGDVSELKAFLAERDIVIHDDVPLRFATHLDVTTDDVDRAAEAIAAYFDG